MDRTKPQQSPVASNKVLFEYCLALPGKTKHAQVGARLGAARWYLQDVDGLK